MKRKKKTTPKVGDRIYIQYGNEIVLRKINAIHGTIFEWFYGFSTLETIKENPNKKSKVNWIHKHY